MEQPKPSTADILAAVRKKKAEASGAAPAPAPASEAAAPPAEAPAQSAAAPVSGAPKPPAAKPGSTKDILAAIRAQKAGGAASAETAAPAATAQPAKAPAAPVSPGGARPSPAEMLKALREGKTVWAAGASPAAAAVEKPAKVAPPMPVKPVAVGKKGAAPAPVRRSLATYVTVACVSLASFVLGSMFGSGLLIALGVFVWGFVMSPFVIGWTAFGAVTGASALGTARFMFPNVLVEPPSKFKVGPASDYPLNSVSNKWKDQFGVWVVHTNQYEGRDLIVALSTVCTHLGCTPNWLDGEQKFKCPCHGSGFYMNGVNFEGPAPRPLERHGIRIAEDGMLEIDKSMKFQEEMGQWADGSSFVEAV